MTTVPEADAALVDARKVRDYLLNEHHPQNGGKAALFGAFGFTLELWERLQAALARHVVENEVLETTCSIHGTKYVVACRLGTPDGRNPCVTSIWVIEPEHPPRLVTAYR